MFTIGTLFFIIYPFICVPITYTNTNSSIRILYLYSYNIRRFLTYEASTRPIINHFDSIGKCKTVDSNRALDDVFEDVKKHFE